MEVKSNIRRKKLHRTNQGSIFFGGSFSNRDNVRALIQFKKKVNPSILKDDVSSNLMIRFLFLKVFFCFLSFTVWIYFFLVITFDILSFAISFFFLDWKGISCSYFDCEYFVNRLLRASFISFISFFRLIINIFQSFLTEFLSQVSVSFIAIPLCSFCPVGFLVGCLLLFCHCFSCTLCFWYSLLWNWIHCCCFLGTFYFVKCFCIFLLSTFYICLFCIFVFILAYRP